VGFLISPIRNYNFFSPYFPLKQKLYMIIHFKCIMNMMNEQDIILQPPTFFNGEGEKS
jgi:hypothetical protein